MVPDHLRWIAGELLGGEPDDLLLLDALEVALLIELGLTEHHLEPILDQLVADELHREPIAFDGEAALECRYELAV